MQVDRGEPHSGARNAWPSNVNRGSHCAKGGEASSHKMRDQAAVITTGPFPVARSMVKRTHSAMQLPTSPESSEYSEHESDSVLQAERRKKVRHEPVAHDFNGALEDTMLEFLVGDTKQKRKFRSHGKPLVIIFYGIMNGYLDGINDHYEAIMHAYNATIIGVSSNVSTNKYKFPLINSTQVIKKFNVLDPLGGGVYPRDVMIVFDKNGKRKHEIPLKHMNMFVRSRPVVDVLVDVLDDVTRDVTV